MVVIRSDYTFARYHGERIPFGDVQTCVNRDMECHTEGYVMYDTAGTGLVLDDVVCIALSFIFSKGCEI